MDLEALKKSFVKKFQEDTAERLQKLQLAILELEKAPKSAHEQVARDLHTMKGEARMLGLSAVGQLSHAAEDVLRALEESKLPVQTVTDLLLKACDGVAKLLEDEALARAGTESATKLCELLAAAAGQPVPPLQPGKTQTPSAATIKAAKALAATAIAASEGDGPKGAKTKSEKAPQGAEGVAKDGAGGPVTNTRQALADRHIRVNVEILDALGVLSGDLLVEGARSKLRFGELTGILQRFSRVGDRLLKLGEHLPHDPEIRRAIDLLETDLHLLRDDAFRFVRQHLDGLNTLQGSLSQLADDVAEARLVPLATVFETFPRAVRELARGQEKEVELVVDNPNVGVDRSMLADVRDALVHLLRNAVDHGVETPAERQEAGKPRAGKLRIGVRANGDMLDLEVQDDGRGMEPEAIKRAAVRRRLVTQVQAAALSEREALELVFLSGFTTREEVTDLSGRGVGLDVVRQKVEALGGSVMVTSAVGKGTTFSLRLPQSLALMRVLLVRLGTDVYGIPATEVEAVVRVHPDDRLEVMGTMALRHRGRPVSLVALGPLLALNGGPRHDRPPAVIVRHGEETAALVVDGFVDEREVAVKPCGGDFLAGAPFIGGTAAIEDGRIAVLLHVPDLMAEVRRATRQVTAAPAQRRLRVLLVDDSPIARATESALVRALGHEVEEAQDGEEAWGRLLTGEYDLVLTDIQMPKLDGFQLTRKIKAAIELGGLPVIVLSSLASPEDKRRGADAGADAYLVKGELGLESLAEAIDRLA